MGAEVLGTPSCAKSLSLVVEEWWWWRGMMSGDLRGRDWGSHCSRGPLRQFGGHSVCNRCGSRSSTEGRTAMPVHVQPPASGAICLVCAPRSPSVRLLARGPIGKDVLQGHLNINGVLQSQEKDRQRQHVFQASQQVPEGLPSPHRCTLLPPLPLPGERYSSGGTLGDGNHHMRIEPRSAFNCY